MKLAMVVAMVAGMVGCSRVTLPNIPEHHWRRGFVVEGTLYADTDGHKSASVIELSRETQVCDFDHPDCENFETTDEALNWLRLRY